MAVYSQNGYVANDRSVLDAFYVGDRKFLFRRGAPGLLLHHAISWFDANIKDINPGIVDDWSFAERLVRGGEDISNHASGTAGDVDATKWPLGVDPSKYLTADQIRRWREHLKLYEGCIRWGGDYVGRLDPMHVEVNRDEATCNRVWAKINAAPVAKPVEYRFPVIGSIRAAFDRVLPGLNGATWGFFLGQPVGPEAKTADGIGRWQAFDKGTIYWHPNVDGGKAHVVWGAILTHWRTIGNEGVTGYPLTDELSTPDTVGRYNRFAGDWMIYWTPATGAHAVHGAFLGTWAAAGYERSKLGYPISDEVKAADGRIVQEFQRGSLILDGGKVTTLLR